MLELLNTILSQMSILAYPGIVLLLSLSAIGIPVPEEVVIVGAAVASQQGGLEAFPAWLSCYIGVVIADVGLMYFAHHVGMRLLKRKWMKRMLHPRRLMWARKQIAAHGAWAVMASRFIPGSRMATLIIAGASHTGLRKFAIADAIGALATVSIYFVLGWIVSTHAGWLGAHRWQLAGIMACIGIAILGGYVTVHLLRNRRATA